MLRHANSRKIHQAREASLGTPVVHLITSPGRKTSAALLGRFSAKLCQSDRPSLGRGSSLHHVTPQRQVPQSPSLGHPTSLSRLRQFRSTIRSISASLWYLSHSVAGYPLCIWRDRFNGDEEPHRLYEAIEYSNQHSITCAFPPIARLRFDAELIAWHSHGPYYSIELEKDHGCLIEAKLVISTWVRPLQRGEIGGINP